MGKDTYPIESGLVIYINRQRLLNEEGGKEEKKLPNEYSWTFDEINLQRS